ncbi:MAG: adenylate/guanylate cyclase domain-containing protein [Armatimonadota bacterium]|nr:adenylate/guanylate cyclase domain-containing protein [Armatimonadota bacterium]MDR7455537.1 adenylate/guanylate cyclase domain-containing protein [Armatimonadota bacterium]MDR7457948.1 adenylate/guanylate cyclase domain-containing protein [Armatimonadota bacterium]MDR7495896.1 adenylate/guanylate cyclase domain-containing protein [Armatimonadota bacterium]
MHQRLAQAITRFASVGVRPQDSDDERLRKSTLTIAAGLIIVTGLVWSACYALLGLRGPASIPLAYSVLSAGTLLHFAVAGDYRAFRFGQLLLILVLPFATQWALGGFAASGAVMMWAFMAPLGALLFAGPRAAVGWLGAFLGLAVASGILDGRAAEAAAPVAETVARGFFVMNIAGLASITYLVVRHFVREKERAQERSERLLLNVLPAPIAERLKRDPAAIADHYAEVTVLFADIVDFTRHSTGVAPRDLVQMLNDIFSTFDQLAERHGLEKIKTIGDAYMVVGGLPRPRADHAHAVAAMALGMQDAIRGCAARAGLPLELRVGISTGPVVAGVIGQHRFIYDLWGDTVNTASRMESHGLPGVIQVSPETYQRLADCFAFEPRGPVAIKGKGMMTTYLLRGPRPEADPRGAALRLAARPD